MGVWRVLYSNPDYSDNGIYDIMIDLDIKRLNNVDVEPTLEVQSTLPKSNLLGLKK